MARQSAVYLLGGEQTDFGRNWAREGFELADMMAECLSAGEQSAEIDLGTVEVAHVGNFVADLFTGQGHLGGLLAEAVPEFRGIPISRHEAACASGSMALMAAMADLESGRYALAAVLGLEMMRNVTGERAAGNLAGAAWVGHEAQQVKYCWPHMFHRVSEEYHRRYGLDYRHIAAIAQTNYANARNNPNAQTRKWQFEEGSFSLDDKLNPVIDGWIRRNDCGQVTDGAAVLFLANEEVARVWARKHNLALESIPRIKGWGHRTARMSYQGKIEDSQTESLIFPHVAQTVQDAFKRAGVQSVFELDAIETHDCFAITEYMAIDHFGITAPGESWKAIEEEIHTMQGRLPINPSGGLIGCGHPVGATGVRMALDAYRQVANKAADYQVTNARNVATLNIGGSTTTSACFVIGVDQ